MTDDIWLNRIEDIKYFETDPQLSREQVISFGQKLRSEYYEQLPAIVDAIELADQKELYPLHSDFFSRLGMTFDHGDYSRIDAIKDKTKIAEKLYLKSLHYYPDVRAYLGLGILYQKNRDYENSIRILSEGLGHFSDDEQINICLAVSLMNVGAYPKALAYLLRFQHSQQALGFIATCYQALNEVEKAAAIRKRL